MTVGKSLPATSSTLNWNVMRPGRNRSLGSRLARWEAQCARQSHGDGRVSDAAAPSQSCHYAIFFYTPLRGLVAAATIRLATSDLISKALASVTPGAGSSLDGAHRGL